MSRPVSQWTNHYVRQWVAHRDAKHLKIVTFMVTLRRKKSAPLDFLILCTPQPLLPLLCRANLFLLFLGAGKTWRQLKWIYLQCVAHTGCSLYIVFSITFFWSLSVLLQRWCSTCLVCGTHTDTEGKQKGKSPEYFKIFQKNTIFNEHPVVQKLIKLWCNVLYLE